jgi:hypothetical protein
MQNSFRASRQIAFVILVGLWVCLSCTIDRSALKKPARCDAGGCAGHGAADEKDTIEGLDEDSGTAADASGTENSGEPDGAGASTDTGQAGSSDTNSTASSGGQIATGTGGVNPGSAGAGGQGVSGTGGGKSGSAAGSGGQGAAGTGSIYGSDLGTCQLACASDGAACAGMCIANFDPVDRSACENQCFETTKSCDAQCAFFGSGSVDPVGCRTACAAEEIACPSTCITYSDPDIKKACENHCVENKNACDAQC